MNEVWSWLTSRSNWEGAGSIGTRIGEHLAYCGVILALAALIAVPILWWRASSGRQLASGVALGWLRLIPFAGVLMGLEMWLRGAVPWSLAHMLPTVTLGVLAVLPVVVRTLGAPEPISEQVRANATGLGLSRRQAFFQIHLPCALPAIYAAIRGAWVRAASVVAIAAAIGSGGLGRFLIDGMQRQDAALAGGGAVVLSALVLLVDGAIAVMARVTISPGVSAWAPGVNRVRVADAQPVLDPIAVDDVEGLGLTAFDEPS